MVFIVAFSATGMMRPGRPVTAASAIEAAKLGWAESPFGDAVDATVMGGGYAYQLRREGLEWSIISSRSIPGMD